MAKSNIQPFRRHDRFADGMIEVVTAVNNQQQDQLWLLKDTFPDSQDFGAFLWDNQLMDLAKFFTRRYWVDNFPAIIRAMEIAGTYEAILIVVESAMGTGRITFENPNPSHLIVNISVGTEHQPWVSRNSNSTREQMIANEPDGPDDFYFVDSSSALTFEETAKLIELLNVTGVFIEVRAS